MIDDFAIYPATTTNAWKKGATVVNYGQSGQGLIYQTASETNSPYQRIFTHTGTPWDNTLNSIKYQAGNLNGVAGVVTTAWGVYAGNYDTGQYMRYDDVSGQLVVNDTTLLFKAFYGDGSDGDVVISANTAITSDMFYDDLTINNGYTLTCHGFRIFVSGTLTNNGTISTAGNSGTNGSNGGDSSAGVTGGGGHNGTGATTINFDTGSIYGSVGAMPGVDGKNGRSTSGAATSGTTGGSGGVYTEIKSMSGAPALSGHGGGAGGVTVNGTTYSSAVGGNHGSSSGTSDVIYNKIRNIMSAYMLHDFVDGLTFISSFDAAGAGSGASGAVGLVGGAEARSGGGGGSGGSGGGGGTFCLFARKIINNGTFTSQGGNGGNGGNAGVSYAGPYGGGNNAAAGGSGGGGGGAGGTGGSIIIIYNSITNSGTITAAGGTSGTGGTPSNGVKNLITDTANNGSVGTAPEAGKTGNIIYLQV
jgi:hypothetical protein